MTAPTKTKKDTARKPRRHDPLTKKRGANLDAETRKLLAEAREAEHNAHLTGLSAEAAQQEWDERNASDFCNHVYRFSGGVGAASVATCQRTLAAWHRLDPDCDITIVINSPGGSVVDGMALWDYLQFLRNEGHTITTVCEGMAASMAGILLQAGTTRVIGRESYLMIHEISASAGGKIGEITDAVKWYEMVSERVANIFVERSGGKISKAAFKKGWLRTDWWISSDEALKLGFVDEVR